MSFGAVSLNEEFFIFFFSFFAAFHPTLDFTGSLISLFLLLTFTAFEFPGVVTQMYRSLYKLKSLLNTVSLETQFHSIPLHSLVKWTLILVPPPHIPLAQQGSLSWCVRLPRINTANRSSTKASAPETNQ